jgi:holo-[acyl-carrier protein] synthase
MLRTGIDLISIDRIERLAARHGERFYTRFFTPGERAICQDQPFRLAARVAAKEAAVKALGVGIGDVKWTDIEVGCDERQRPILWLHGAAGEIARELGLTEWEVSLTHEGNRAAAVVVMTGP